MKPRLICLGLLCAAAVVELAVTAPRRASLEPAENEQRRLREERRELMRRLLPAERVEADRQRALLVLAAAPPAEGHEAQALRRTILSRIAELPVHSLRVTVQPARGGNGGVASLSCEGSLDTVLRASSEVLRPGSGLLVSRARLQPTAGGMLLELDATALRRRP